MSGDARDGSLAPALSSVEKNPCGLVFLSDFIWFLYGFYMISIGLCKPTNWDWLGMIIAHSHNWWMLFCFCWFLVPRGWHQVSHAEQKASMERLSQRKMLLAPPVSGPQGPQGPQGGDVKRPVARQILCQCWMSLKFFCGQGTCVKDNNAYIYIYYINLDRYIILS